MRCADARVAQHLVPPTNGWDDTSRAIRRRRRADARAASMSAGKAKRVNTSNDAGALAMSPNVRGANATRDDDATTRERRDRDD